GVRWRTRGVRWRTVYVFIISREERKGRE
ncbi:MAG: hypothetical protein QG657_2802, partial [Acidobacteriota bacterium]|nr:hypothetical protein [Acidobacteriota bacterium]